MDQPLQPPAPKGNPKHSYADLRFVGCSGHGNEIVTFGCASDHDAQRTNLVSWDGQTGEITCTCRHAETRPAGSPLACWHSLEVREAWYAFRLKPLIGQMDARELRAANAELVGILCRRPLDAAERVRLDLIGDETARRWPLSEVAA